MLLNRCWNGCSRSQICSEAAEDFWGKQQGCQAGGLSRATHEGTNAEGRLPIIHLAGSFGGSGAASLCWGVWMGVKCILVRCKSWHFAHMGSLHQPGAWSFVHNNLGYGMRPTAVRKSRHAKAAEKSKREVASEKWEKEKREVIVGLSTS